MHSQEDSQQSIILRTPTPVSSPSQSQMTPSTYSHRNRPSIHLIPPPSFTSTTAGTNSFGPSSSTSASTMATPIDPTSAVSLSIQPHSPSAEGWEDLSPSLIDSYDLTTLRSRLQLANQLIRTLSSSLTAMRTNAAHYLLQHKILEMETTEAAARHQVESEITRREVEVLRLDQSAFSTTQQLALAEENETYKRRLRKAKRSIREYREELGDIKEENERLKKRIRDNRQHQLDASRSPDNRHGAAGGHVASTTAERHGPSRRPTGTGAETDTNEDDGLAALRFLASQVLSQEMDEDNHDDKRRASTPKPKLRKPTNTTTATTAPPGPAPHTIRRALMSPVAFTSSTTSRSQKRRRSRDSTISASDGEDVSSDINESGKRRRIGTATNILHGVNRQRRCTHSPHPTPTAPLINEHRNNRRHHTQGADTPPLARTLPPGTPISPPGRREKVRDVGSDQHLRFELGVGLGLGLGGGIRSPP